MGFSHLAMCSVHPPWLYGFLIITNRKHLQTSLTRALKSTSSHMNEVSLKFMPCSCNTLFTLTRKAEYTCWRLYAHLVRYNSGLNRGNPRTENFENSLRKSGAAKCSNTLANDIGRNCAFFPATWPNTLWGSLTNVVPRQARTESSIMKICFIFKALANLISQCLAQPMPSSSGDTAPYNGCWQMCVGGNSMTTKKGPLERYFSTSEGFTATICKNSKALPSLCTIVPVKSSIPTSASNADLQNDGMRIGKGILPDATCRNSNSPAFA
mmetsp:Transcript_12649/g.20963  ORF Transcript_12649/g.20963 Transcript_12649/m.20963 type:complete len:268 (-) Transcript_12649:3037-3840(-)